MIGLGARASALEITRLTQWSAQGRVVKGLGLLTAFSLVALLFAPWQQTATAMGEVIAYSPNERPLVVEAPIEGRVAEWRFVEGERVERGEVIVALRDNDPRAVARYRAQVEAAKVRVEASQRSARQLEARLEDLEAARGDSLDAVAARIRAAAKNAEAALRSVSAAEAKARTASTQSGRKRLLFERGLTSERDLEVARRNAAEAEAGALSAQAKLEAARAEVRALRASRGSEAGNLAANLLKAESELSDARAKLGAAESKLAGARRDLARQKSLLVRAPRSGMLTHVRARESAAYVKKGEPLAEVVPSTGLRAVELYIQGRDAPLVVPGQEVMLQFHGWPAIQFGGWPGAAVGTFRGEVAFVGAEATEGGRFRVVALPAEDADWPDQAVLRQGNQVSGWILLETVSLGYELWRQMNGFPPDLPPKAEQASGVKDEKK